MNDAVLVVDDDPEVTAVAGAYLGRRDGLTVETRTDPEQAVAEMDGTVDCVVTDYEMPRLDGLAVLESVRADYPDIPVVVFSGTERDGIVERVHEQGARFVRKGQADGFDRLAEAVADELA